MDVLIVSLGSTGGLRAADTELAASLRRAGVRVSVAAAIPPSRRIRTLALTDLAWARAVREAALATLAHQRPRAIIYSSTTAALLWPRPGAVRFDAPSAANRPGRHGLWQRPLERLRQRQAPVLRPWSEGGLLEAPAVARREGRALVIPVPVEASGEAEGTRDLAAITYAANPSKKGLDRVLSAWRRMLADRRAAGSPAPGELIVAGASAEELTRSGFLGSTEQGIQVVGELGHDDYRALLRRARVFVCAPRREDYGIAQLEALADGCQLVTTLSPGPYAALPLALALDPRLIGEDLAGALQTALEDPLPGYAARARQALAPFSRREVDRLIAGELLPRLLA